MLIGSDSTAQVESGVPDFMYVLLVEDDELIRMTLVEVMTEAGFDVVEASDGEDALALVGTSQPPLLVVSDVNLGPGMSGFALGVAVRLQWPTIPMLLMSGVGTNFAGRQRGVVDRFMVKPFSHKAFLQNVTDLTGKPAALAW
jgi:DNA-binding response OmpR family regulator